MSVESCNPCVTDPADDRAPWATMIPSTLGGWIRATDYDALQDEVERLRSFAAGMLDLCPHTECEGVQELAVQHGVLVEVTATDPCGEGCHCAELVDFPTQCFRIAPSYADGGSPS